MKRQKIKEGDNCYEQSSYRLMRPIPKNIYYKFFSYKNIANLTYFHKNIANMLYFEGIQHTKKEEYPRTTVINSQEKTFPPALPQLTS